MRRVDDAHAAFSELADDAIASLWFQIGIQPLIIPAPSSVGGGLVRLPGRPQRMPTWPLTDASSLAES